MSELAEVASLLWSQRELLEQLLFKLVQEQLVLSAGQTRWLAAANRELEAAVEQLRGSEVLRAIETDDLAVRLGLTPGATLAELAAAAPEPWSDILTEHRDALRGLTAEIDAVATENARMLDAGARAVRETLLSVTDTVATYDAHGSAASNFLAATRLDEQA